MTGNVWTDDMIRYFARLHRDKRQLSFEQIAAELSAKFNIELSRNACIGKARRLGLPMRDNTPRTAIQRLVKKARLAVEAPIVPVEAEVPIVLPAEGLTIYQLHDGNCHWPLGETYAYPPFMYCDCPALLGRPYCETHTEVATGGRT